jgi:demethylmenaquinone methyltransferase/2-methoxy-6-polyprenyl-1,4-benzoquinol methylase
MHQGHEVAKKFFTGTSSSYDAVVNIATFGQDMVWKRAILDLIPNGDHKVLDLACGTGILSFALARKVSCVVGLDITEDSIRIAREKALLYNMTNTTFYVSAAEAIPQADREFDFVTASYLPKYCDVDQVVSEVARVLKHGGMLIMHDFTYPDNSTMKCLWNAYFKILRIAGVFVPSWRSVFSGLDTIIKQSNWVNELMTAMRRHGFSDVRYKSLTVGTAALVWGRYVY